MGVPQLVVGQIVRLDTSGGKTRLVKYVLFFNLDITNRQGWLRLCPSQPPQKYRGGKSMPAAAVEGEPKVRAHGSIRVSLPARIAYNPDALKKTIGGLLEQLGCPRCFSGADCLFTFER